MTFPEFRLRLECVHDKAHPYFADVDPHNAFRDPFVFLLHSNVDRIYAQWQTDPAHPERLDPNTVYGAESNKDVPVPDLLGHTQIQNLTHLVEPWSTGIQITEDRPIRPWEPAHENQGVPHDYHHISVVAPPRYDTNSPEAKTYTGVYILIGAGGIQIEYAISNGTPYYLYYTNPAGTYTFREGDVHIQESPYLGRLVTVVLPPLVPWLESTTFTLVVPSNTLGFTASQPINTIGIETDSLVFPWYPGQRQHYREIGLQGWAYFT